MRAAPYGTVRNPSVRWARYGARRAVGLADRQDVLRSSDPSVAFDANDRRMSDSPSHDVAFDVAPSELREADKDKVAYSKAGMPTPMLGREVALKCVV